MPGQPLPAPVKALRASLRTAREPGLRDRLSQVLRRVERLYGLGTAPPDEDTGDMRRRRFVQDRHPVH